MAVSPKLRRVPGKYQVLNKRFVDSINEFLIFIFDLSPRNPRRYLKVEIKSYILLIRGKVQFIE